MTAGHEVFEKDLQEKVLPFLKILIATLQSNDQVAARNQRDNVLKILDGLTSVERWPGDVSGAESWSEGVSYIQKYFSDNGYDFDQIGDDRPKP